MSVLYVHVRESAGKRRACMSVQYAQCGSVHSWKSDPCPQCAFVGKRPLPLAHARGRPPHCIRGQATLAHARGRPPDFGWSSQTQDPRGPRNRRFPIPNVEHACRCRMRMFASLPSNVVHACRCSMRSVALCIRGKVTLARRVHSWPSDPCPCTRATPSVLLPAMAAAGPCFCFLPSCLACAAAVGTPATPACCCWLPGCAECSSAPIGGSASVCPLLAAGPSGQNCLGVLFGDICFTEAPIAVEGPSASSHARLVWDMRSAAEVRPVRRLQAVENT